MPRTVFFPPDQVDHAGVGIPEDAAEDALGRESGKAVEITEALIFSQALPWHTF